MEELRIFEESIRTTLNPALQAYRDAGGKIVGYFCTNVPHELILAAGALPYRIRAPESRELDESDRYMTYQNCSYCRHVVNEALKGRYEFLDGFVGTNGCDQMRRVSDVLRAVVFRERIQKGNFYMEFVAAPRVPNDARSEAFYRDELARMRRSLEKHFGLEITDRHLFDAIERANETRSLLHEFYGTRKSEQPPFSGAESLAVTVASTCLPIDIFNCSLKKLLKAASGRVAIPGRHKRLFLYGGILDNPAWVRVAEELGGLVVADGLCFGARMFWDLVEKNKDPLTALARRYYRRWPCPRVADPKGRQQRIHQMVSQWRVDGLIGERLVFCQPWGAERVTTTLESRQSGLPCLWLDREYLPGGFGQMKTRIQAFLESL